MATPPREAGARHTSSSRCGSSGPRRSAPDDDAKVVFSSPVSPRSRGWMTAAAPA